MRKSLVVSLISIALLFSGKGCIPVEDLGEYWEEGIVDPNIEGHWKKIGVEYGSEDIYISFVKAGEYYLQKSKTAHFIPDYVPEVGIQTKTLMFGSHKFLMIDVEQYYKDVQEGSLRSASKMAEEMGEDVNDVEMQEMMRWGEVPFKGGLQRYEVKGQTLIMHMLKEQALHEAIKRGQVKGTLPKENERMVAKISKLDKETIGFIVQMVEDPNCWKEPTRYERIADLEQALRESRTYPATEDTLKNTLVDINLPDLKYFAEGKTHILLRHLQASREWKVFIEGQRMVCHRRKKQYGRWNDPSAGFQLEFLDRHSKSEDNWFPIDDQDRAAPMNERNWQQMRYLFRFEKEPFGYHAVWAKEPHVMKLSPLEGKINIELKIYNQGIESYLAVGQPGLWFECFEQTWHEERKKTRNALKLLKEFLREVRAAEEEIHEVGYVSKLMPPGYVKKGNPTLELKWDRGVYCGQAWVNPRQQGYVYLRVFNADTQKYLPQRLTGPPLKEYIGFSKDPTSLFSYKCRLYIRGDQFEESFNARCELWFHPSDGGPDRQLISVADKILPDSERTIDTTRSGKVIDKSGKPIRDARVMLYGAKKPAGGRCLPFECTVVETTTTDDSGIFAVTMKRPYRDEGPNFDRLFVVALKDGFSLGVQYFHSLETSADKAIVPSESTTVAGRVIDERGQALHGVEVHVYPIKKAWEDGALIGLLSSTDLSTTITDREGRFAFDHIPIEAYVEFYAIAEGYLDNFTWEYRGGRTEQGKFEAGAPDVVLKMQIKSGFAGRVKD